MSIYTQHKNGFYLYTGDSEDGIQRCVMHNYYHELDIVNWIDKNTKPGWLVYDLGANIGEISEMCAYKGATVHAFEAQKDLCEKWQQTRQNFNNYNDITIHNIAISDKVEDLTFYVSHTNRGGSSFSKDFVYDLEPQSFFNEDGTLVETQTIRTFPMSMLDLPDKVPDLIKLDIQDYEEQAWDGMPEHIKKAKNVIAEVLFTVNRSLIEKYMHERKAYTLDENLIASTVDEMMDYIDTHIPYFINVLFK